MPTHARQPPSDRALDPPQILLLVTRNVTLVTGGFAWHRDRFMFGSAGNAGNPGNADAREVAIRVERGRRRMAKPLEKRFAS